MSIERAIPGGPQWARLAAHHVARYLFAAEFARGKRVLDAGCGAGYGASLLQFMGAAQVLGVDIDEETITAARQSFAKPGVAFIRDDVQSPSSIGGGGRGGAFDLIVSFENIEHLSDPNGFLKTAQRLLAPAGLLLVSTPDKASTPPYVNGRPANVHHLQEWNKDEFLLLLSNHFPAVELRVQVKSHALAARERAVTALKQQMMWSNPLGTFLWRKFGKVQGERAWRALDDLAAPALVDFPILDPAIAGISGTSYCHVALCRSESP